MASVTGRTYAVIPYLPDGEHPPQLRVIAVHYRGRPSLHIREYRWSDAKGRYVPSTKGIAFAPEHCARVIAALGVAWSEYSAGEEKTT